MRSGTAAGWFPAPAKLNLFLHVVGRRADGYHLLQTLFAFLDHGDRVHCEVDRDGCLRRSGNNAGIAESDDLVVRAAHLLKAATGTKLGATLTVEKHIPMGGGLGGGSSDAATVLVALNHLWQTGLSRRELQAMALELGADVPVFVFGHAAFAEGVGELLQAVELPDFWALVLTPPAHLSTQGVFTSPDLTRDTNPLKIADFSAPALLGLCARSRNTLQDVVVKQSDAVARYLAALEAVSEYSLLTSGGDGSKRARMTGSGACVFALFESCARAEEAQQRLPADMQGFVARGLNRHPLFELTR